MGFVLAIYPRLIRKENKSGIILEKKIENFNYKYYDVVVHIKFKLNR